MATPRSQIVDEVVTPFYHCISRCVRRAFLCGHAAEHRKAWIEDRLRELVELFAIDCAGFAVMDNHLHVLLRLDSQRAAAWASEEVARRWLVLFPRRDLAGRALPVSAQSVSQLAENAEWVERIRRRLCDLSWFMKCLKEPLARRANREDQCSGAFWEGRFKSIAVHDMESVLATLAYIDLNPFAAGVVTAPETSAYTSLHTRIEHCRREGSDEGLRDDLSTRTRDPRQERDLWLLPLDDTRDAPDGRAGLLPGFTLSCYLRLMDETSRVAREGKAYVSAEAASIFTRLNVSSTAWTFLIRGLFSGARLTGTHLGSPARLAASAERRGCRWHRSRVPRRRQCSVNAA